MSSFRFADQITTPQDALRFAQHWYQENAYRDTAEITSSCIAALRPEERAPFLVAMTSEHMQHQANDAGHAELSHFASDG